MLEKHEARFIHAFLEALLGVWKPSSLVLIHEGIWVGRRIPEVMFRQSIGYAQQASGLLSLRIRVRSLQAAHLETKQHVISMKIQPAEVKKFRSRFRMSPSLVFASAIFLTALLSNSLARTTGNSNLHKFFQRRAPRH